MSPVHNHGPGEGRGLACGEAMVDGKLRGHCLDIPQTLAEGVWALVDFDHNETITSVFQSELEALRAINGRGYGEVKFVQWGRSLYDGPTPPDSETRTP